MIFSSYFLYILASVVVSYVCMCCVFRWRIRDGGNTRPARLTQTRTAFFGKRKLFYPKNFEDGRSAWTIWNTRTMPQKPWIWRREKNVHTHYVQQSIIIIAQGPIRLRQKNGERNNIHFSDPLAARASGFLFYGMGILISY